MRVKEVFREVADLTVAARARYFAEHRINEYTRREVEGILAYESAWTTSFERNVGSLAVAAMAGFDQPDRRRSELGDRPTALVQNKHGID